MRELKFKVWDKASKTFLYSEIAGKHPFHFIGGGETYEIVPSCPDYVIVQYTGLKDKHGQKIYEGDIVRILDNEEKALMLECDYDSDTGSYVFKTSTGSYYWEEVSGQATVVGNIFQNPKLLKK